MKREELEKHLGRTVEITLFDGDTIKGELHKTREERFKNEPNLYIPYNYYFLINPQSCIFICSPLTKEDRVPRIRGPRARAHHDARTVTTTPSPTRTGPPSGSDSL